MTSPCMHQLPVPHSSSSKPSFAQAQPQGSAHTAGAAHHHHHWYYHHHHHCCSLTRYCTSLSPSNPLRSTPPLCSPILLSPQGSSSCSATARRAPSSVPSMPMPMPMPVPTPPSHPSRPFAPSTVGYNPNSPRSYARSRGGRSPRRP